MRAHLEGLGHMERYEYGLAAERFRDVRRRAPGWIPGSINLAISLLNDTGTRAEGSKEVTSGRGAGGTPTTNFEEALGLLDQVLGRDPGNLSAHYCRGIILEYQGRLAEAHSDFRFVVEHDPSDGHAWFKLGSTLTDPDDPNRPAGPKQAAQLIEIYTKALERNPYLVTALYKLQAAYAWAGDREKRKEVQQLWERLNPKRNAAAPGETAETFYGEMGRYARVVNPLPRRDRPADPKRPPRFDPPARIRVTLPEGQRWVKDSDLDGPRAILGRARARFGAAVAAFDADGDGRQDLFLAAAIVGGEGLRDALLLNRGEGVFEEAAVALGLPADRASLGVAAGDFDADRKIDLFLTGVGDNRLYRNLGSKGFADVTEASGIGDLPAVSLTARWLDLDQDGDLDLYVVNYTSEEHAGTAFTDRTPPGMPNAAYRNDGKPEPIAGRPQDNWAPLAVAPSDLPATSGLSIALTPWTAVEALLGGDVAHIGLAALDLDDDRDLDLVLSADGVGCSALLNDRLGRFHSVPLDSLEARASGSGLLVTDFDKDGHPDLVSVGSAGRVVPWRNRSERTGEGPARLAFDAWPTDARGWRSAFAADLDLDGWPDLLGLPLGADAKAPAWARNEGDRLAEQPLALGPDESASALRGHALVDLVGDPLPDLVLVGEGEAPRLARNLGNGHHWLALELGGRWKFSFDQMRTNPHGLGARLSLEGQGLNVPYDHTTPEAGLAQSVGPVILGLGRSSSASLLRLRWPDGVMQCELNVPADQLLAVAENNRKTGSCPVLFTWNGERFACLGDFLGGGGLGYLVAPGLYSEPDRDESVAIAPEQLRAVDATYRLAVTEPMDEVAYLDQLCLEVVDRPPGVSVAPDERFAPTGPRPTGDLIAWRTTIEPVRATDLDGKDVTETLRTWDRRTVDGFRRLGGWIGYAEEHGVVIDFGDRLRRFGPGDSLVLCLAGWVEYPYSQTNYAAATAGVSLRPPVLERRRDDGSWEMIEPAPGYPAGLPRLTTLDLTGKLCGPSCVIRLRTNMECYWDQAFLAVREPHPGLRVTRLCVARARLGYQGYTREVSPDGRLPQLYDYDHIDPAPLARMNGRLTRYGDVAALLLDDDDRLCVVGPGDEVRLEFDAASTPALPEGWTRSFVLRAIGYCKDADPFTASSDSIGPLPWRGMPDYPFGPEGERPLDPGYRAYLRDFQTRATDLP